MLLDTFFRGERDLHRLEARVNADGDIRIVFTGVHELPHFLRKRAHVTLKEEKQRQE